MLKNFRDRLTLSGIIVLAIGVALLIFTFVSAYEFLTADLSIITSQDLASTFGQALAPLIATCIRIMYLGIMGWVGSLITIRGVTIITHVPQSQPTESRKPTVIENEPQPMPQKPKAEKPMEEKPKEEKPKEEKPKEEKPKEEKPKEPLKPQEPQVIVMPPQAAAQPKPSSENSQKKNTSPQAGNY
jgi:cytoskeletal protein RodZ